MQRLAGSFIKKLQLVHIVANVFVVVPNVPKLMRNCFQYFTSSSSGATRIENPRDCFEDKNIFGMFMYNLEQGNSFGHSARHLGESDGRLALA